jgi:hypothetical protein
MSVGLIVGPLPSNPGGIPLSRQQPIYRLAKLPTQLHTALAGISIRKTK